MVTNLHALAASFVRNCDDSLTKIIISMFIMIIKCITSNIAICFRWYVSLVVGVCGGSLGAKIHLKPEIDEKTGGREHGTNLL